MEKFYENLLEKEKKQRFMEQYYFKTEAKDCEDIEIFVDENTADLVFINTKTQETVIIVKACEY